MSQLQVISSTTSTRTFKDHEGTVYAVAVFPDMRRMVTGSEDKILRLWDLETGVVLKKMEGHSSCVQALAVSHDGQIIASGDNNGEIIAWHGETGESLTQPIKAHSDRINSVVFSPDGAVLATGSWDGMTKFWCTKTWQMQGDPIDCASDVNCIRYSPSGELLGIATDDNIQIYNTGTRKRVVSFKGHTRWNRSLAWTPDGTRLLSAGDNDDPTIREWDPLTWQQVGHPWKGHTDLIFAIAIHPAGSLAASASWDNHVRLWRLSDQRTVAIFQHSSMPQFVTFSVDGRHILSGGYKISEWEIPKVDHSKIVAITSAHNACITGDLPTAEDLLTQEIRTDANNYASYAHRSFIMARKHAWDHALEDAIKSISIQPSLIGHISKGIALCGQGLVWEAKIAFDIASVATSQDSTNIHFIHLIKAIALFNANHCNEAMLLIKELATIYPNTNTLAHRVVEVLSSEPKPWVTRVTMMPLITSLPLSTRVLFRRKSFIKHMRTSSWCVKIGAYLTLFITECFIQIFGWDLPSLLLTTHQKRCQAFLSAAKIDEALEAHKCMMGAIDETAKTSCLDWSNEFKERCSALAEQDDRILSAEIPGQDQGDYDAEPNFFHGMPQHSHQHSQNSRPRPQQRHRRLKRLMLAMTRTLRSASPPAPPTTSSPVAVASFKTRLRHLFTRPPHHATPPVVDVPFAQGLQRNAAAGAPKDVDNDLIRDEDYHRPPSPDPNLQQRQQAATIQMDTGEHGNNRSCCCC